MHTQNTEERGPQDVAQNYTAFEGSKILAAGRLADVALSIKRATESRLTGTILVFDDETGRVIDLDLRGTEADVIARLSAAPGVPKEQTVSLTEEEHGARGPGRPKLGVVSREVTLLPNHWEWLAAQPGGASVTLRKLVHEARRAAGPKEQIRAAQEATARFLPAMAGDMPGYEEASRALFAQNRARFQEQAAAWPADIRDYAVRLAFTTQTKGDPQ